MKLLKTMTYPGFPETGIETITREAARIVLVDDDGMAPLLYSSRYDVYIIPGGGIDEGENILDAVVREAREETGCEIEILGEIGKIIEQRPAHGYSKGANLKQTSYCYYGKVISKGKPELTKKEIEKGFMQKWLPINKVKEEMKNCTPNTFKAELVAKRDMMIFEEYLKIKSYL